MASYRKGFQVEASIGHIRDPSNSAAEIPAAKEKGKPWARLGIDVENDFSSALHRPRRKEENRSSKLKEGTRGGVDILYLATDEDREGESISLAPRSRC